jgi:hypothetical protein
MPTPHRAWRLDNRTSRTCRYAVQVTQCCQANTGDDEHYATLLGCRSSLLPARRDFYAAERGIAAQQSPCSGGLGVIESWVSDWSLPRRPLPHAVSALNTNVAGGRFQVGTVDTP